MLVYIICWIVVIIVAYFCYLYFKSEFKKSFGIQDKDKIKIQIMKCNMKRRVNNHQLMAL